MKRTKPAPLTPILQFGTSRFLLAHADLFISEAMDEGKALGPVTIVQTTDSAESKRRIKSLAAGEGYPVRLRGLMSGKTIDKVRHGNAIVNAVNARSNWEDVRRIAVQASVILSNTGDRGFDLDPADDASLILNFARVPRSFPAKLTALLFERWWRDPQLPLSIFPCELITGNGDRLRGIVAMLAREWRLPEAFIDYVEHHCRFVNSLVDRIVSQAIEPIGAVAEPYATWVIERCDRMILPCTHDSIVVTDDLDVHARLKLHILNLGHTFLAERWLAELRSPGETVRSAMADPALRHALESVWRDEVIPVFAAEGLGTTAAAYVDQVRERFLNPFLAHRISDIAANHEEKKQRRIIPIVERAAKLGLCIDQRRLLACL